MNTQEPTFHLSIGEIILCTEPSVISTVLGSCVSVCLYSERKKMGGMIHYGHPKSFSNFGQPIDFRYGEVAIPALIEEFACLTGETPSTFTAKIAGGASELVVGKSNYDIGLENIKVAKRILAQYRISITGEDTGHTLGRKVLFFTASNRLQVADIIKRPSHPLLPIATSPAADIDTRRILVIGASTGGTEALKDVLLGLPPNIPPTLIVQHIPPVFSTAFAERLNQMCPFEVKEAEDGDELKPSRVLIAPGGKQMKVKNTSTGFIVAVNDDPPVNLHKPSVDYLFLSVAEIIGKHTVGVILTGMGADGAKGLLEMHRRGSKTIAQDESSSVVYGMPKAAHAYGAVDKIVRLDLVAREIVNALKYKHST
ncbi:MAG: hypothetical protein JNM24_02820 [Bdellovibrionaceae bacterium]|nr:hypothetical protein [Pseudobdellovibrionaceae bacterium]